MRRRYHSIALTLQSRCRGRKALRVRRGHQVLARLARPGHKFQGRQESPARQDNPEFLGVLEVLGRPARSVLKGRLV